MNLIEALEERRLLSATIHPTSDPGNTLGSAYRLGAISGTKVVADAVSPSDSDDYYRISLASSTNFNVKLSGLSDGATVQILSSAGDTLDNNPSQGTSPAVISRTLSKGTYYIRVLGSSPDSDTAYTLSVNADLNQGRVKLGKSVRSVSIDSADGDTSAIDPRKQTWLVIHGMLSTPLSVSDLANAITHGQPKAQVLVLDWSDPASQGLDAIHWVAPVAKWAAATLTRWGIAGSRINLVGHSFGGFMTDLIAQNISHGVNRIVALDPATDVVTPLNYAAHSRYSLSFIGSNYATPAAALTADAAFRVKVGDPGDILFTHSNVRTLFANMIESDASATPDPASSLISLDRLSPKVSQPWKPNAYSGGYEGVIVSKANDHTMPNTFSYKNRITGKTVTVKA